MTATSTDSSHELLLVCGMHRSGTSVVTRCLELFGYSLGESLMEPGEDNPTGFFEDLDVVRLNDDLLLGNGSTWDAPVFTERKGLTWSPQQLAEAAEVLKGKLAGAPKLAIKDPRVCLTLPFWRALATHLDVPLRLCLIYRNPLDIAASIERRNQLPAQEALALTQLYWSELLKHTEAGEVVIDYTNFIADPKKALEDIATWLQTSPESSLVNDFLEQFLDDSLQHHTHSWSDLVAAEKSLPAGMLDTASLLKARAKGEKTSADAWEDGSKTDPRSSRALLAHQLADRIAQIDTLSQQLTALELETAQQQFEVADISRQRDERNQAISVLEKKLSELTSDIEKAKQAYADANFELADIKAQKSERESHIEVLAKEAQELEGQIAAANAYVADREQALRTTQADFERAEQARVRSEQAQQHAEEALRETELQVDQLNEKADWLFSSAVSHHGDMLRYELSFLGRCHRLGRRGFRFLTLRRGQITAYDQAVANAHNFYRDHGIPPPRPRPSKKSQLLSMVTYTLRHPISSMRSMSLPRLKTVLSHIRRSSAEDLEVWVNARFEKPQDATAEWSQSLHGLDPNEVLAFPTHEKPLVSIVIPVYNEWVVTHRCLWSVLEHTTMPYEVIVADDCSTDETADIGNYVTGVTVIRQEENQRFLKNCNLAARHAKGEYLLFLNNDTAVTANWLEPLVTLFDDATVGVVGPKLLFPDGKLQEAGGVVWQDASGWNFGRADDPRLPQYSYVRETDYVSGAALMIRHALWSELGGFDEAFVPAYYEDTDLCFQARNAGFKVIYQPASEVVHYEGLSHGTDTASGQKQYQLINQQTFLDKWSSELQADHFPNAEHVNLARDRSRHQKRLLIIDHYIPHYDKDAGSRSTWMYVEMMLKAGYRVQFMGANFFPHEPYTSKLQQMGVEVLVGEQLARHLDRWFTENLPYVDHIFLHRPHIAEQFLPHLKKQTQCPPITFVGHDLHFLRSQREYDLTGDSSLLKQVEEWRKRELNVINAVDHTVYFSEVETQALADIVPEADIRAIPLYILEDKTLDRRLSEIPQLLFVAGFNHPPNIDAACWFVSEVLPLLEDAVGAVHLHIAGSNPNKAVQELASENITVHGYLSDEALLNLYSTSHCAVVPLRFGAGVKGKVLEAIQYGVPLVTTSVGAEGIPDAEAVMAVADEPEAFARAVAENISSASIDAGADRRRTWLHEHYLETRGKQAIDSLIG